jgi:hypothetical protein
MKISSPFHAQIIFLIGGRLAEDYIHFIFDEYRVKGEWFRLGQRLSETIEQLAPEFCLDWLREDEENHRLWIAEEAQRLGLLLGGPPLRTAHPAMSASVGPDGPQPVSRNRAISAKALIGIPIRRVM